MKKSALKAVIESKTSIWLLRLICIVGRVENSSASQLANKKHDINCIRPEFEKKIQSNAEDHDKNRKDSVNHILLNEKQDQLRQGVNLKISKKS